MKKTADKSKQKAKTTSTSGQRRYDSLGNFLKTARENRGFSQGELASHLGYTSPQFISNVERGLCSLPLKKLKMLIPKMGLSEKELINVLVQDQERIYQTAVTNIRQSFKSKSAR